MLRLVAATVVTACVLAGGAWRAVVAPAAPTRPTCCCAMPMDAMAPAKPGCGCHLTPLPKAPDFAPAMALQIDLADLAPMAVPTAPRALGAARRAEVPVRGRDPPDGRRRW